MALIAFDTETTGLEPQQGHRIVEIGCVILHEDGRLGDDFHRYLNPEREVPEEASRIHNLTFDFLKDKPLFREVASAFLDFIEGHQLVAHNASFDVGFLNHELQLADFPPLDESLVIDSLDIARSKYSGERVSLDALCRRFDISLEGREFHGALKDARLLAAVYARMMGMIRQHTLFVKNEKPQAKAEKGHSEEISSHDIILMSPSNEELAEHQNMKMRLKKEAQQVIWEHYD